MVASPTLLSRNSSPRAGSFLRPSAKLSFGTSFLAALGAKYLPAAPQTTPPTTHPTPRFSRRNLADIEIEAPNMDAVSQRVSRLSRLRQVGLGGWRAEDDADGAAEVARAFGEGEQAGRIAETCPSESSMRSVQ